MRTIQSPGVEIRERDLSQNPVIPVGTNVFLAGFAPTGPTDEILQVTSVAELEQIYGIPTTPAERYFYFTARQIIQDSPANLFVNRLPYGTDMGNGFGNTYGALVYPVASLVTLSGTTVYRTSAPIDSSNFSNFTTAQYNMLSGASWTSTEVQSLSTAGIGYVKYTTTKYSILTGAAYSAFASSSGVVGNSTKYSNILGGFFTTLDTNTTTDFTAASATYLVGKPKFFELTKSQYLQVLDGTAFTWAASGTTDVNTISSVSDFGKAGLIVLNLGQSTVNSSGEGYYAAFLDNTNAEPTSDYNSVFAAYTISQSAASTGTLNYTQIPADRLYFTLSATNDAGNSRNNTNISLNIETMFYGFADATTRKFDDTLAFKVYKLRKSPYTPDIMKLEYVSEEGYLGSLDYARKIQNTNGGAPISFYLGGATENSPNARILVNSNINNRTGNTWLDNNGTPTKKVRLVSHSALIDLQNPALVTKYGGYYDDYAAAVNTLGYTDSLFPMGPYAALSFTTKNLGSIPLKLDRALSKIENDEVFPLDIVVEGGLGTIYAACSANGTQYYDDTVVSSGLAAGLSALATSNDYVAGSDATDLRGNYHNIFSRFDTFCTQTRKDCLFISDPIRHIFVRGENTKTLSDQTKSFSQYIYGALRHNLELANTNYACTYGNWVKVNDPYAGINVWVPFSGFAAADMANTDANFYPWYATAGFTRGKVNRNVLDMAITPKQKERDQLYKIGINPVAFFPNDGFVIYGQKTLQRQPSAFDRINVRRLFLFLEKGVKATVKYFVFEPNSLFTRTRIVNTIKPIFELARTTDGVYDYLLVCDKRNNTPDVIDNNELVIDIYIKPVRTAEYILVNFIGTRTGVDFNELLAGPRV